MSKQPDWLMEEPLQQFFAATAAAGGEARVVGGAVRDFLLGVDGADVDVASTLTPEQTTEIAARHNWKAIPTGIAHGTVTLVLPNRIVEVTTLRRDVTTDGRRATVAFTQDWREDASRRDFTINAMSMDSDGKIYDYFNGQSDAAAQRVRFIGDASTRITEDALRILRFFRFLAVIGKPPADAAAIAAITANKEMLTQLSGERIANEMRKLLGAHNPAYALRLMQSAGVAAFVFGRAIEPATMIRLQMLEGQADYQCSVWARALALLFNSPLEGESKSSLKDFGGGNLQEDTPHQNSSKGILAPHQGGSQSAQWIANRWKLSRHESQQIRLLATLPKFDAAAPRHFHTRILRLHGAPVYLDWLLVQAARVTGIAITPYVHLAHDFVPTAFPVTAKDLMAKGMEEGKALGEALAAMEQRWEESDYTLTKEDLLQ